MIILRTLALEPMHGYGIGVRIEQISRGVFQVNAGSLFPALRRLERDGLIKGEWAATENNRRASLLQPTGSGAPGSNRARGTGSAVGRDCAHSSCLDGRAAG
jgi:DNA-binding PadR family transcriptional regulator